MAKKNKSESQPEGAQNDSGTLEKAAQAIGSVIGKIAAKTGVVQPADASQSPKPPAIRKPKFVSKGKKRLPRKEKKRLQKAAAKQTAPQASSETR